MPNRNYIQGRKKEYLHVHALRKMGFTAFRSAGSHSPFDVIGINPVTKEIMLIQCKPASLSKNKIKHLEGELSLYNGLYTVFTYVK